MCFIQQKNLLGVELILDQTNDFPMNLKTKDINGNSTLDYLIEYLEENEVITLMMR